MTCREKLTIEHPDQINYRSPGGCCGCPDTWGYLDRPDYCGTVGTDNCTRCWDREIPEESDVCKCYDKERKECRGTRERDRCSCEGQELKCDFYANVRENALMKHIPETDSTRNVIEKKPTIKEIINKPSILDSGTRREFETGAVRDIQEGKGRCDLMPLDVVGHTLSNPTLAYISNFQLSGTVDELYKALSASGVYHDVCTMILEVAKHFEEGAKKYGEYNWQKGIPVHCYIDSAVRHYLKFLRGDKDEPHDRAFVWNILCAIWTCKHKPKLNDYTKTEKIN